MRASASAGTTDDADVVVVGSGIGGLTAGAMLAYYGKKVRVRVGRACARVRARSVSCARRTRGERRARVSRWRRWLRRARGLVLENSD